MPKSDNIKSVLVIGSGPIIIGQACEFDYSGTQAVKSIMEEGIDVTLINSNPATIMTDYSIAKNVYLKPLNVDSVKEIISKHKIDAILPTVGGQTALNLCMKCQQNQLLEGIEILGCDIDTIEITEDREKFKVFLSKLGLKAAPSKTASSYLEGKRIFQEFGVPVVIRSSFTLGGTGASIVYSEDEFDKLLSFGLESSPIHEVIIDKALIGWKEYELELIKDKNGNVVVIAVIENMDPMGVHTGDSVTICPSMTLSDSTYQNMRDIAIKMMRNIGYFVGGCNVQFAVSPDDNEQIVVVEINPRVSRSSALASKATGYPIAKVAAKLAIGYNLDELENQVTKNTSAFFEPSLDYVIVKIPRWNFDKFPEADQSVGLQMKSVGEVMGIGRSFQEALQKSIHSLEINRDRLGGYAGEDQDIIFNRLSMPAWDRFFYIYNAMEKGISIDTINSITKIDKWFLYEYLDIFNLKNKISKYNIDNLPVEFIMEAKLKGFSDVHISEILNCSEEQVYDKRVSKGVERVYKMVDTCSAEFEAKTPYYYSTFESPIIKNNKLYVHNESQISKRDRIMVIGSGPNRIGQGIEFDYCCVQGVQAVSKCGYYTIMVNCNPETVSTDFDVADKLYFEPLYWEYVKDIIRHEKPLGVIVQFGGQTSIKLSKNLHDDGIKIIGTSFESMDLAEDRGRFSNLLKDNDITYPKFGVAETTQQALNLVKELNFPILVRPSYVLGGQGMKIVINEEELERHIVSLIELIPGNKILLDHYLDKAIEVEIDAICDGEETRILGIMEHIEPCGIHSGDSNAVLPYFSLSKPVVDKIKEYSYKIAKALKIIGLINIQFAVKDDEVYVIEANPRASRTLPFISKAYKEPYIKYSTEIMLGHKKIRDINFNPIKKGYAIKNPVFSFDKFPKVNKNLGPEMKSTGEEIIFIDDLKDDIFTELYSRRNMYLNK